MGMLTHQEKERKKREAIAWLHAMGHSAPPAASGTSLYTFTTSQTWTPPRVGQAVVTCYGGCGNGGIGAGGMGGGGGGGGGGGVARSTVMLTEVLFQIQIEDPVTVFTDDATNMITVAAYWGSNGAPAGDGASGGAGGTGDSGDILHSGGNGGDGGAISGAGGTRATPTSDGIEAGGAAGVGDDQPGLSAANSGGSGGGNGTSIFDPVGGTGAPGYVTVEYV